MPLIEKASLPGFPSDIRFWADEAPPDLEAEAQAAFAALREANAEAIAAGEPLRVDFLALSGGGGDGAFGAGLLNGWTETGERPEFQIVTGVSTGAIIAPLAFLGPDYDDELREAYTQVKAGDIFVPAILSNIIEGPALIDTAPLENLIDSFVDEALLEAVAREHREGRRLFVATTHLDAGRPMIWDLGAIASEGGRRAQVLFRAVISASAAIPGLFPPVPLDVVIDGIRYRELHVDGGVTSQVFAYQPQIELGRLLDEPDFDAVATLWAILNGSAEPEYDAVPGVWWRLSRRSLNVLLNQQRIDEVARIRQLAERHGLRFRLASVPEGFKMKADEFDPRRMQALFFWAEAAASEGYCWRPLLPEGAEGRHERTASARARPDKLPWGRMTLRVLETPDAVSERRPS